MTEMQTWAPILVLPWLLALISTPAAARWAAGHGWLDQPGGRKLHERPTPLLGGLAVFASVAVALGILSSFSGPVRAGLWGSGSLVALGTGALAMLIVGAWDDRCDMRPGIKLLAQIAIAAATWYAGFRCGPVELPFGREISGSEIPSFLVTLVWIVVVTNAFNLIDGLDGLASGLGILASLTIFVLAVGNEVTVPVIGSLALAGSLAGFLRSNLPPARIFLGDAGSMTVGYSIAVLSLASYQKGPTAVLLVVPLIVLALPIVDTAGAIIRRAITQFRDQGPAGLRPLAVSRAIFQADRRHIHHLLLRLGWSPRRVLFFLYAVSAALGGLGLWTRDLSPTWRWMLWGLMLLAAISFLRRLEDRVDRIEKRGTRGSVHSPSPSESGGGRLAG